MRNGNDGACAVQQQQQQADQIGTTRTGLAERRAGEGQERLSERVGACSTASGHLDRVSECGVHGVYVKWKRVRSEGVCVCDGGVM